MHLLVQAYYTIALIASLDTYGRTWYICYIHFEQKIYSICGY